MASLLPGDNANVLPSHTLTGDRSVDVDVDISPLGPDSVALPASANSPDRSDSWQSNVNISSPSAFRVVPVDDEVQFYCRDARTPIAPQPFRYAPSRQSSRAPSRQSVASAAFDPFVGLMNRMMERMERCDAERREAEMRERMRLEAKVVQLEAAADGLRVAPLTSVASDVCASRPHAAPPPSMLIDRGDTAQASIVDEFDVLSPRGGDVAVASDRRGPPAVVSAPAVSRPLHGNGLGSAVDSGGKGRDDLAVSAAMGGLASASDSVSASAAIVVSSQPFTPAAASTVQPYDNVDVHPSGVELSLLDGSVLTPMVACVLQRRHSDWTLRSKQCRLLMI